MDERRTVVEKFDVRHDDERSDERDQTGPRPILVCTDDGSDDSGTGAPLEFRYDLVGQRVGVGFVPFDDRGLVLETGVAEESRVVSAQARDERFRVRRRGVGYLDIVLTHGRNPSGSFPDRRVPCGSRSEGFRTVRG